ARADAGAERAGGDRRPARSRRPAGGAHRRPWRLPRRAGRACRRRRAAQLAGLAVGARRGDRVLDLCAAPGGKATQLAGEVVAVEKHPGRARELRENVTRLGASNVTVLNEEDMELPSELAGIE